ncbi:hypothetical protein LCGC14_1794470 [marine sediment metagenome]|uniref:PLD phosphodiesterase domain-containing protein n=1 Tax=marine sediment metagenome TaxID=412755 RepID=A0A0F9GRJ2_9ZZZZ
MNNQKHKALLEQIRILADEVPCDLVASVADAIGKVSDTNSHYERSSVISSIAQADLKEQVGLLFDTWQRESPETSPESVALALLASAETAKHCRESESISLVWTGPKTEIIPLRRTDQALLQVINEAQEKLLVVSFVVYKIEQIRQALIQATNRGVDVSVCVEDPEASAGKINQDTIKELGESILQKAKVYIWPLSQRQNDAQGHYGSLHVKCAIADDNLLFISSANLTGHALNLNMELGVLIRGGILPGNVSEHFRRLIEDRALERML